MAKGIGRRSRAVGGGGGSTTVTASINPPETGFVRGSLVGRLTPGVAFRNLARIGIRLDRDTANAILRSYKANITDKARTLRLGDGSEVTGVRAGNVRVFMERVASAVRRPGLPASARLVDDRNSGTKLPGIRIRDTDRGRDTNVPFVRFVGRRGRRGNSGN
jgi:hypothetical protein